MSLLSLSLLQKLAIGGGIAAVGLVIIIIFTCRLIKKFFLPQDDGGNCEEDSLGLKYQR